MSKKEKLIKRLLSKPKDFTFDELVTLLHYLGYDLTNKGKTSGSRVEFVSNEEGAPIALHKPHPSNQVKPCYLQKIIRDLKKEGKL